MKKGFAIILAAAIVLAAAGCGASSESAANKTAQSSAKTVSDALSQAQETTIADREAPVTEAVKPDDMEYADLDFDAELDLTEMSSTMVYAEVSNMVNTPDKYLGKTVKIKGSFDVFTDPNTKKYYYSCMVKDATACCANGIEFAPQKDLKYPDDFPNVGMPVTVGGTFETYKEGETTYLRLKNAQFSVGKLKQ